MKRSAKSAATTCSNARRNSWKATAGDLSKAYAARVQQEITVQVRSHDGKPAPSSRNQHLRCLESCGLNEDKLTNAIMGTPTGTLARDFGQSPDQVFARPARVSKT